MLQMPSRMLWRYNFLRQNLDMLVLKDGKMTVLDTF